MDGRMIDFAVNGGSCSGYLSSPSAPGFGVIVLQEWWGLVPHIKEVCDRFAEAGFNALAPDLYDGESTTEPDEAGSLMMALNIASTEKKLASAVTALLADPNTKGSKVGIVGFCMGGQLSMFAACQNPEIGACVNFYGVHPAVSPDFSQLHAPMLGIFAETDPYASPEVVNHLSAQLTAIGKPHEFITYPGTQHAFFNDHRLEVFAPEPAADAWKRTLSFFDQNLA